jgi:hypothetical protein
VCHDFVAELCAQHDLVLASSGRRLSPWVACVPNPCLGHEIETSLMDYGGLRTLAVGTKKDGRAEDPRKCSHHVPVLGAAPLQTERFEHLGTAPECDPLPLLSDGEGGKEDGD